MEIKEWMAKKDNYESEVDKEGFINKSTIELIKILSKIKRNKNKDTEILCKVNPLIKLIGTILIIIFLSISKDKKYIFLILAYCLVSLCTLSGNTLKRILSVSFIVPAFSFLILLPSIVFININNSLFLILKIFITITLLNLLSYTTKWNEVIRALKKLFFADLFILILIITINYIYILGEISLNMLYALKLRSIGRNRNKNNSMSKIMGNLFLKAKVMGDEMYSAMECRGFTGDFVIYTEFKIRKIDIVYIIILSIILIMFFII